MNKVNVFIQTHRWKEDAQVDSSELSRSMIIANNIGNFCTLYNTYLIDAALCNFDCQYTMTLTSKVISFKQAKALPLWLMY